MRLTIVTGGREVSVDVRDRRSVPDMLKLCRALGMEPLKWWFAEPSEVSHVREAAQ